MASFLGEQSPHIGDLGAPACLTTAPCRKQLCFKLVAAFALRGAADGGSDVPWTDPGPSLFGWRRGAWVTAAGLGSVLPVRACPVGRGIRSSPFPCEHSGEVCGSDSAPPPPDVSSRWQGAYPKGPPKCPSLARGSGKCPGPLAGDARAFCPWVRVRLATGRLAAGAPGNEKKAEPRQLEGISICPFSPGPCLLYFSKGLSASETSRHTFLFSKKRC